MAIKSFLLGKKIKSAQAEHEKMPVWKALAILSSDALSSVAYATEQILIVLAAVGAAAAFAFSIPVALCIVALIILLVISYRQVIEAYPQGGGAYMVSKENLSPMFGRLTGASLLIDYTLTVAVSISAGVQAITSAFPAMIPYVVEIALLLVWIMVWINLRGTSESGSIFAIPTYFFLACVIFLVAKSLFDLAAGNVPSHSHGLFPQSMPRGLTVFLLLRAFSSGCSAVTGIEAISDAVPHFKSPGVKNAKKTLLILGSLLAVIFSGVTIAAMNYGTRPDPLGHSSVLSMIAEAAFGRGLFYYALQIATMLILTLAANTAFNGFPILASIMAQDSNFPRMFSQRGERLSYHYGIITLGALASALILIFGGKTEALIPLYAIGVFLSFTLAQSGLVLKWIKEKPKGWGYRLFINGLGAAVSFVVLGIFSAAKFLEGAWIVVLLIPFLALFLTRIYRHYGAVGQELKLDLSLDVPSKENMIIIPVAGVHRVVAETIAYAKTLSPNIVAFYVGMNEEDIDQMEKKWKEWNPGVRLEVFHSRYRDIVHPLVEFIERVDNRFHERAMVTVLLPEFVTRKWWHKFLHNQSAKSIRKQLFARRDVVVSTMPYHLTR